MRTNYQLSHVPASLGRDLGDPRVAGALARAAAAAGQSMTAAGAIARTNAQQKSSQTARRNAAKKRVRQQFEAGRLKFTPETQPRDNAGKFRRVLARLKMNLGDSATEQLAKQMEAAEKAGELGDYAKAREAGAEVIKLVDSVDDNVLKEGNVNNIRKGAAELGKLLAYLPLPQGDDNAKIRFSDLPAATGKLIDNLVDRVREKVGGEKAEEYVAVLKSFMSGGRLMSADEMSAELSKILRVLA